ncbi:MAG: DNA gyrase subunit A [Clostridia bacterium]|nr:DNA gyrase subunit A [Clostridia bacterium]
MTKMLEVEVDEELKKSFIAYAMAVNVSRAIPDVRDGLKPVHRRILYSMHELGLYSDKPFRKCARIVGDCLGKYHPHGDSSVYDALVRLAQDFTINFPLIEGHGNFGSVDGDPPAAMRYTEARLSKLAAEMLRDLDKETVDFYPTFDDTGMQPTVLPSRIPNILVNGSDGIAVGMATNIPPHNLGEVIDGCVAMIDNPDIDVDELMQYIPAPDFPTGACIMGRGGVRKAYKTGRGSIILRSRCEIEDYKSGSQERTRIVVSEIPYQVNKSKLIVDIAALVKDKRIDGISDIRDESDRDGMRIVIELKKEANAQVVLNYLYKHTNLQISDGLIMLALVDGTPKILNLREFLYYYLQFQKEVITRRTRFDLAKTEERAHIVRGLVIAQASIDEVVEVCKTAADKADCVQKLTSRFELDERQATAVAELRLYRLSHLEVDKLREELESLENAILDFNDILNREERVMGIIKDDLMEIKRRFPSERKTEIVTDFTDIEDADLIPVESVVISLTHDGYIKRIPLSEYRAQNRGGVGITGHKPKEEDFVESLFVCSSHDRILLFSTSGKVYSIFAYEVPEYARNTRGLAVQNIVQLDGGEKISSIMPERVNENGECEGFVMFATRGGLIKKTPASEFARINRNGKIAIRLVDDDKLISVQYTTGGQELIVAASNGKCLRFNEMSVRAMGRGAAGVKAMKLRPGESMVDMLVIEEGKDILTVSSNGFGKRCAAEQYPAHGRGTMGSKAGVFNEVTGTLVNMKLVSEDEDVMMITSTGIVIRMHCSDISKIGRGTKGVKLMRLRDGGYVATVAVVERDDEEEAAVPEESGLSEEEIEREEAEFESEAEADKVDEGESVDFFGEAADDDKVAKDRPDEADEEKD